MREINNHVYNIKDLLKAAIEEVKAIMNKEYLMRVIVLEAISRL